MMEQPSNKFISQHFQNSSQFSSHQHSNEGAVNQPKYTVFDVVQLNARTDCHQSCRNKNYRASLADANVHCCRGQENLALIKNLSKIKLGNKPTTLSQSCLHDLNFFYQREGSQKSVITLQISDQLLYRRVKRIPIDDHPFYSLEPQDASKCKQLSNISSSIKERSLSCINNKNRSYNNKYTNILDLQPKILPNNRTTQSSARVSVVQVTSDDFPSSEQSSAAATTLHHNHPPTDHRKAATKPSSLPAPTAAPSIPSNTWTRNSPTKMMAFGKSWSKLISFVSHIRLTALLLLTGILLQGK